MHRLDAIVFTHVLTHSHAHILAYIAVKTAQMSSGDLKTYKYVKISKSNFFKTTILSKNIEKLEFENFA